MSSVWRPRTTISGATILGTRLFIIVLFGAIQAKFASRFARGRPGCFTVRIGDHHRAVGWLESETVTWVWIGTHAEYDRLTQ